MSTLSEIKNVFKVLYETLCHYGTIPVTQNMDSYINHFVRLKNESSTAFFFCTYGSNLNYLYFLCCLESSSFEPLWFKKVAIENVHEHIRDVVDQQMKKRTRNVLIHILTILKRQYRYQPVFLYTIKPKPIRVFGQHIEAPFEECSLEDVDRLWFKEYPTNLPYKLDTSNDLSSMA